MGHLRGVGAEHRAFLRRLRGGQATLVEPRCPLAWDGWKTVLELLCSPQDALLASRLPVRPADLPTLCRRLGCEPGDLLPRLDRLCDRGLVLDLRHPRSGDFHYMLAPPVVGIIELTLMRPEDPDWQQRMAEALQAYTLGDDTIARELFAGRTVVGRAMVREDVLSDDDLPEVLDWERATALVDEARVLAVSRCFCRHKAERVGEVCDAPQQVCLTLDAGADYVRRHRFGRPIERAEAMEILLHARERGLIQIADNVQQHPTYLCNCCGCCCGQLQAINRFGLRAVNPSPFVAGSDPDACVGCSRCARACPIGAISMEPRRLPGRRKAEMVSVVDTDRCIGCGLCAATCRKGAMRMRRRASRPSVPRDFVERTVRMALERGHLPDLLFDAGAGPGPALLNRLLRVVLSLPGAQRLLATEQVASRCVRALVSRMGDVTSLAAGTPQEQPPDSPAEAAAP